MVAPATKPETLLNGSAIAKTASEADGWYTAVLRDGSIISFRRLALSGDWLRLVECVVYGSSLGAVAVGSNTIEVRSDDVRLITGEPKKPAT